MLHRQWSQLSYQTLLSLQLNDVWTPPHKATTLSAPLVSSSPIHGGQRTCSGWPPHLRSNCLARTREVGDHAGGGAAGVAS
jgi:hypothetical protein